MTKLTNILQGNVTQLSLAISLTKVKLKLCALHEDNQKCLKDIYKRYFIESTYLRQLTP